MGNLQLAGFGKRFVAYIIDVIVLGIIYFVVLLPFGGIFAILGVNSDNTDFNDNIFALFAGISGLGIALFTVLGPLIYETFMLISAKQATFGKMAMKIKVTKENGQKLELSDAMVRTLIKYVSGSACILLFVVCAFAKNEQNLHDMAAKTLVSNE